MLCQEISDARAVVRVQWLDSGACVLTQGCKFILVTVPRCIANSCTTCDAQEVLPPPNTTRTVTMVIESTRSLAKSALGATPAAWFAQARVRRAQRLLENDGPDHRARGVNTIGEGLGTRRDHTGAAEALRGLIDAIVLTPQEAELKIEHPVFTSSRRD